MNELADNADMDIPIDAQNLETPIPCTSSRAGLPPLDKPNDPHEQGENMKDPSPIIISTAPEQQEASQDSCVISTEEEIGTTTLPQDITSSNLSSPSVLTEEEDTIINDGSNKRYFTRSAGTAPPFAKRICKGHDLY